MMVARQELPGDGVPWSRPVGNGVIRPHRELYPRRDQRHFSPYHTVPYGTDPG